MYIFAVLDADKSSPERNVYRRSKHSVLSTAKRLHYETGHTPRKVQTSPPGKRKCNQPLRTDRDEEPDSSGTEVLVDNYNESPAFDEHMASPQVGENLPVDEQLPTPSEPLLPVDDELITATDSEKLPADERPLIGEPLQSYASSPAVEHLS